MFGGSCWKGSQSPSFKKTIKDARNRLPPRPSTARSSDDRSSAGSSTSIRWRPETADQTPCPGSGTSHPTPSRRAAPRRTERTARMAIRPSRQPPTATPTYDPSPKYDSTAAADPTDLPDSTHPEPQPARSWTASARAPACPHRWPSPLLGVPRSPGLRPLDEPFGGGTTAERTILRPRAVRRVRQRRRTTSRNERGARAPLHPPSPGCS